MRKIIRYIFLIPIFIIVVALAVANRTPVSFSLNPFDPGHPVFTFQEIPLFFLLFCALLAGILLGGISSWRAQGKWRRRARKSQHEVKILQNEAKIDGQRQKFEPGYILPEPDDPKVR